MAMLDVFNSDAFSLTSLTAIINEIPYAPGRIGELGLFEEQGINLLTVAIESLAGLLELVETRPRGAPGKPVIAEKRKVRLFRVPHLPERAQLLADEVQGVRAFGTESHLQAIETVVNGRLTKMRRQLEATLEYHRIGAIKGQILDADATTVIYDLFAEFGVEQQTVAMALPTAGTEIALKSLEILEKIEDALGGATFTGVRVFCGAAFWRALITHSKVKETYLNWTAAASLRADPREAFEFGGIRWERYRGKLGSVAFIADDEAYAVPEGVPELFATYFAPADYVETVNTNGIPVYAKQERLAFDKGVELEAQSNPLSICKRPRVIIKLTRV